MAEGEAQQGSVLRHGATWWQRGWRAFSAFSSRAFLSAFSCSFAASRAASSRACKAEEGFCQATEDVVKRQKDSSSGGRFRRAAEGGGEDAMSRIAAWVGL